MGGHRAPHDFVNATFNATAPVLRYAWGRRGEKRSEEGRVKSRSKYVQCTGRRKGRRRGWRGIAKREQGQYTKCERATEA